MKHTFAYPYCWYFLAFVACLLICCSVSIAADKFPEAALLPPQPGLPDPLVMLNGQRITTSAQWLNQRRPELKALFQHYMYGYLPQAPAKFDAIVERVDANFFGGKATKKEITIAYGPPETPRLHLLLILPNSRPKPVPVFLGLNFHGNYTVVDDPFMPLPDVWVPASTATGGKNQAADSARGSEVKVWNIEQSIDRGYAVATFYNGDLAPDKPDFKAGLFPYFSPNKGQSRGPNDWGAIAAWAWGFHRAVDYLQTDQDLDARKIAAVGHSRMGKAAMLAAAFDERIALVIPLQAGCGGTAPSRGKIGESVKQINDRFPHWFNDAFKSFNSQVERLPFDQHCLVALVAPRPVLFANATEDSWANPAGQFEMLQAADPVYRLLKAGGLDAQQMPETGKLVDSKLGYFIRPGKHSMTQADWQIFLDFADKHFGKPR